MGLGRTPAVVAGGFPLGESDRVITFFTREHGKLRGVARRARRTTSRLAGALELPSLGELSFFDSGRSDLVRVDQFDVVEPFRRVREDLERLGCASWMLECVTRLTADRDRQPALYALLVRGLRALEGPAPPRRAALGFGVRAIDLLGHRPRLDRCRDCGRRYPFPRASLDVEGLLCAPCARTAGGAAPVAASTVAALERLRRARWDEALILPLGGTDEALDALLVGHVTRLIGQPARTPKFLREIRRVTQASGGRA